MNSSELVDIQLLNDDFTPMEFVIAILTEHFGMSGEGAQQAMLQTHRQGRSTIATMAKPEAEAAIQAVHDRARQAGHPLMCVLNAAATPA